jgi:Undecaprenyl-phosphate glucose phosphotransferase
MNYPFPSLHREMARPETARAGASARQFSRKRLRVVLWEMAVCEFLSVALFAYLGAAAYQQAVLRVWPDPAIYLPAVVSLAAAELLIAIGMGQYRWAHALTRVTFAWDGLGAVIGGFAVFVFAAFLLKVAHVYSRGALLAQLVTVAACVPVLRTALAARLRALTASGEIRARLAVLIGDVRDCARLTRPLREAGIQPIRFIAIPHTNEGLAAAPQSPANGMKLDALIEECRELQPDDVLIVANNGVFSRVPAIARALAELPLDVHVLSGEYLDLPATSRIVEYGNVATARVFESPMSPAARCAKRVFDVTAAAFGLIVLAPVFALAALAIKLDSSGRVFFVQLRHGYNNTPIRILKFRTMVASPGGRFKQASRCDPRTTRVGRFLRATSIDELPQLVNVLTGEMSLVGPRPHAMVHNEMFAPLIASFWRRHNVKPGITGWAQVNGCRGETDTIEKMRRRVEYDLYYVDHWSFTFDLAIIALTLFSRRPHCNAC